MMSDKRKIFIERIKNVLIVVLFLTTVLLLSSFWKDISLRDLSPINIIEDSVNSYIPEPNDLIQPRNILFSFGSDTYTLKKGKEAFEDTTVTDKMMELMRKYIGEASYAEQIQAEQYEEVMSYASVNMRFDYQRERHILFGKSRRSHQFYQYRIFYSEYRKSIYPGQKYRYVLSYYRG